MIGRDDGDGSVEHDYWDAETTGQDGSAVGGTSLQTAAMTGADASDHMDGLDFDGVWRTVHDPDDEYPTLRWKESDPGSALGSIFGTVTNADGDPLEGIDFQFVCPDTNGMEATTTPGADGEYAIELGANRTYELVVEVDGFERFSTEVTVETDGDHSIPIELECDDERSPDEEASPAAAYAGDDYSTGEIDITVVLEVVNVYGSGETIE